jgi:hypothetical protein
MPKGAINKAGSKPMKNIPIFTSRWQLKNLPAQQMTWVSISRGNARFKTAMKSTHRIKELAPSADLKGLPKGEFEIAYTANLDAVGVKSIQDSLSRIATESGNLPLVLLCFCDLSQAGCFCHRRIFADWWQEKTGQEVKEL